MTVFNRSIGMNMLPGDDDWSGLASWTNSDPTPTSAPEPSNSAAPDQRGCGGVVNIASSSMYSQYPANSRFEATSTRIA